MRIDELSLEQARWVILPVFAWTASANAAAERLARNSVAVKKARVAEHVYDPARAVPEGWMNRSGDLEFLGMG
jgi:hypothetical protein